MAFPQARIWGAFALKLTPGGRPRSYHSLHQIAVHPLFSTVYRKMLAPGLAKGQTIGVQGLIGRTWGLWYGFQATQVSPGAVVWA